MANPKVGDESICENCGKQIVFGVPEPTLMQIKYKKYHPLPNLDKPYWFHPHTGNAGCEQMYATPTN